MKSRLGMILNNGPAVCKEILNNEEDRQLLKAFIMNDSKRVDIMRERSDRRFRIRFWISCTVACLVIWALIIWSLIN